MNKQVNFWRNKLVIASVFIITGLLLFPSRASAMMHVESSQVESHDDTHESLDEVLPELLEKYSKNTIQELDCEELTEEEFERVGDAVMESMHGGVAHERMDEMMGGEGSESLRQMHEEMGKRYFNCDSTGSVGNMNMMGMGRKAFSYQWPLAGSVHLGGLHAFLAITTWVAFIAFLVAGARWFWKKGGK